MRFRTGRLQRPYPPFIASPFLLEVYLVPSHCGSRALEGRRKRLCRRTELCTAGSIDFV